MIESMADRDPRPDWVRRINQMGPSVGAAAHLVSLDPDELVRRARDSTGLTDFGDFDGDWRGRLDVLAAEIERTARLSVVGRLMTRQEILRCLRTRLFMTRALHEQPSILDERIEAPIIVTGPGRSGTTILFELLALDPELRSVLATEAAHPSTEVQDPAAILAMTECEQELWADVQPEYANIHEHRSDLPVECIHAMMPSFASFMWWITADIPGWVPDFQAAMQFHRVHLQLLQHGTPRRTWVLKTPTYLPILDLVFAVYPDAVDPASFGGEGGLGTHALMLAVKRRRDAGELPDRFVDLHFLDPLRDPVEAIGNAYRTMGRPFESLHAERIRRYLAEKPPGKHGPHRYDPSDWGYTHEEIRARTQDDVEAYGVELESGS